MTEKKNSTENLKFYSQKAIGIATFIGGPLAAGYLIRENYLSLNKPDAGKKALIFGLLVTVLLFTGIFMLPDAVINKIPRGILPAIYTGIIYLIVEKIQGKILNEHKTNNNTFYSGWKAAGIGLISLVVISVGILAYIFLAPEDKEYQIYDTEMAVFYQNETETLGIYEDLTTDTDAALIQKLETITIPKWKENVAIIHKTNAIPNLPVELIEQNKILLKYAELRVKGFTLFQKMIVEDTDQYFAEIEQIHQEIDAQLELLNENNEDN